MFPNIVHPSIFKLKLLIYMALLVECSLVWKSKEKLILEAANEAHTWLDFSIRDEFSNSRSYLLQDHLCIG